MNSRHCDSLELEHLFQMLAKDFTTIERNAANDVQPVHTQAGAYHSHQHLVLRHRLEKGDERFSLATPFPL